MKKSVITGVALGAFALSAGLMTRATNASAAYRTLKTKSYASTTPAYHAKSATKSVYLWNSTLTKKQHNLKNYPKTTWYVQKSVKLTNGKKTGIFYYVKNKSKSASGYVWRGYLSKGKFTSAATTNSTTSTTTTSSVAASKTQDTQNQQVYPLFTGTNKSTTLASLATQLANFQYEELDELRMFRQNLFANNLTPAQIASMKIIYPNNTDTSTLRKQLTAGKVTFGDYVKQDLANTNGTVTDPTDYNGWSIGVGSVAKNDSTHPYTFGEYVIILVPTNVN